MNLDFDITIEDINKELDRRRYNRFESHFKDIDRYPKHKEFINSTDKHRESCFMAANRVGKSETGAYAVTCWLTGLYPDWWDGKRFNRPTNCLVSGENAKLVRDSIQKKLLGDISDIGSGMIPKHLIRDKRPKSGVPGAYDIVTVEHVSGESSTLQFMSYDQGRVAFQGTERDVIWEDEEPPFDVHNESLIRTMTTGGIVILTFTPLKGMSETVMAMQEKASNNLSTIVQASWDDAPHLGEEEKQELLMSLPPFQRDARSKGIPQLGAGAVYPVSDDDLLVDPFPIPQHFRKAYGMDVGWNNTAVCWIAHDLENDIVYITADYKKGQVEPAVHASAIKAKGHLPGFIDPASAGSNQKDGEKLLEIYQGLGLDVRPADNTVEAGIFDIYERMTTGRLKIFRTCQELITEKRLYRRDEKGKIVKQNDHLMDAMRYGIFSGLVYAITNDGKKKDRIRLKQKPIRGGWMSN